MTPRKNFLKTFQCRAALETYMNRALKYGVWIVLRMFESLGAHGPSTVALPFPRWRA